MCFELSKKGRPNETRPRLLHLLPQGGVSERAVAFALVGAHIPTVEQAAVSMSDDFRYEIRPQSVGLATPTMYHWPIYDCQTDRQVGFFQWDQQAMAILTCERLNREWEASRG